MTFMEDTTLYFQSITPNHYTSQEQANLADTKADREYVDGQIVNLNVALIENTAKDQLHRQEVDGKIDALLQADKGLVSALYTQSITDKQKEIARNNIGAVSTTEIDNLTQEYEELNTTLTEAKISIGRLGLTTYWQLIDEATDFNTLLKQGNYFLQVSQNPNAPTTSWYYLEVDNPRPDRITQRAWSDTNINLIYTRVFNGTVWSRWEKLINQNELNTRFNSTNVGGRNLLLDSRKSLTPEGTITFQVSGNIDYSLIRQLTLACDIYYKNAKKATRTGATLFRAGMEMRVNYTDNSTPTWVNNFQIVTDTPTNYNLRKLARFTVPNGKTIKSIDSVKIQIHSITADEILVKNPKLELYHIMTDWSPAPEDYDSLVLKVAELENRISSTSGSIGD